MTPWKEALERVAKAITDSYSAGEFGIVASAERVIESLSQSRYVVMPREATDFMIECAGSWDDARDGNASGERHYEAMIRAWEAERNKIAPDTK